MALEVVVELQHRERERLHDAKGNLVFLRNSFTLLERDGDLKSFIRSMEALERALTRTVQSMAPEFEADGSRPL